MFGFIPYLTIFQSRLGILSIILNCANEQHQLRAQIERCLQRRLFNTHRITHNDIAWPLVINYLNSKGQLGKHANSNGLYKGLRLLTTNEIVNDASEPVHELTVTKADLWMADSATRSTNGTPTPPNIEEYINLAIELGLLSGNTNSLLPLGKIALSLGSCGPQTTTPFALGLEGVIFLRSIIANDGRVMRPFVSDLRSLQPIFSRDMASELLPKLYSSVLDELREERFPPEKLRECKKAIEPVRSAEIKRNQLRINGQRNSVGVLEHRTGPRLEWLVDLGALKKPTVERNSFSYTADPDLNVLNTSLILDSNENAKLYPEECARRYFQQSAFFRNFQKTISIYTINEAIAEAYLLLKRPVGPVAMSDLCFCASLMIKELESVTNIDNKIKELGRTDVQIRLSGDRFTDAVNVMIDNKLINGWLPKIRLANAASD